MKYTGWVKILIVSTFFFIGCDEDNEPRLPSVEERVSTAISSLESDILAPANGWKLEYKPTDESGIFLMFLEFNQDGTVEISSDVADNDGEFFNHTITWRIDNAIGLQLVFETYGVFHYLFEQDGATFGAEYQFVYIGKEDGNLFFRSFSDSPSNASVLIFEPASPNEKNRLARDIATNLNEFSTISPAALETPVPKQQIIIENEEISVFWSLDPAKRIVLSSVAITGSDFENPDFNAVLLEHSSGYKLQSNNLTLTDPLTFVLNNRRITIEEIIFQEFSYSGPGFCSLNAENSPLYTGQISGIGPISMTASLFDLEGTGFQPIAEFPYSVNVFFIFDETETSLTEEGQLIAESFPDASGFLFYYGFENDSLFSNSVGFILEDETGNTDIFIREFEETETLGNKINVILTDNFFHSGTASDTDITNLRTITDLLFEGGEVYASDFPVEGVTVFKLFNPCNRHEIFLVR